MPSINRHFERLLAHMAPDARLLRARELTGGVSARVTALEVGHADGQSERFVVRQYGAVDLAQNPHVAEHEFALLEVLHAAGLPVPAPIYVDANGDILGSPGIVVEFIDGSPGTNGIPAERVSQELASQLARIHAIDPMRHGLTFLPDQTERSAQRLAGTPTTLDDELDEGRIRATLNAAWPLTSRNRLTLLHGDFWPGNTLWLDGRLSGIIDWEDAGIGDPLADLANTRLELLLFFGQDALDRFTSHYLALNTVDTSGLPYWDLCATLRPITGMPDWGLDADTLHSMRTGLEAFINQAFMALDRK